MPAAGRAEEAGDLGDGFAAGFDVAHGGAGVLVPGLGHDELERDFGVAEESMATNNRPLPRNTVAKKRLAPADPVPEHPMNHKKAMPANGTRFSAIATAESGFIGGPIFPALFIGGTAGVAVHQIFPSVPLGLAFTCLFAAVPGGVVSAPFSVVLLAAFVTQVGGAADRTHPDRRRHRVPHHGVRQVPPGKPQAGARSRGETSSFGLKVIEARGPHAIAGPIGAAGARRHSQGRRSQTTGSSPAHNPGTPRSRR